MPSITKPIDATKYEIRALWTGVGVGHMSEDVEVVTVGYPFEPPDDLGGWHLADYMADKDNTARFFTLWVREKIKVKVKKAPKKKPGAPAPDIQAVIDETKAATAPQPASKRRRGRPPRLTSGAPATPSENGAAEPSNGPPPVAHLPLYEGK